MKLETGNIQLRHPAETPIWGNDGDGERDHAKTQRFHAISGFQMLRDTVPRSEVREKFIIQRSVSSS